MLSLEVVDLLHQSRLVSPHTRLYKPYDTSWNIAGNQLVGEITPGILSIEMCFDESPH